MKINNETRLHWIRALRNGPGNPEYFRALGALMKIINPPEPEHPRKLRQKIAYAVYRARCRLALRIAPDLHDPDNF